MARHRAGPGRPSKGDRHAFAPKVRGDAARLAVAGAGARDLSHSEYLEIVIARYHGFDVAMPDPVLEGLWTEQLAPRERHSFLVRVRRDVADPVMGEADARNLPYSEYLAIVIAQAHGLDVAMPERVRPVNAQEVLDISA